MTNIELVIKIPEEKYNQIINSYKGSNARPKDYEIAIINGTVLSKGHEKIKKESIPYLMHKEMDIPISECYKAYDIAIDYLRSQGKVKG